MPRGRPKKDTRQVKVWIQNSTMEELKKVNPRLITIAPGGEPKFRYGSLGRYIERLILEDVARRKEKLNAPIMAEEFMQNAEERTDDRAADED